MKKNDPVNHPAHYTSHPSGIEVIQITEHENFCRGNAIKYILRAGKKGDEIEDLKKAVWYLNREIERLGGEEQKCSDMFNDTRSSGQIVLDNELAEEQERLQKQRESINGGKPFMV